MKKRLIVSDHAVLRYLDRIGGFDIESLRHQISTRLQPHADRGAQGVVLDGHSFLVNQNGDRGPIVTTVLPVTRSPRNLMGGKN